MSRKLYILCYLQFYLKNLIINLRERWAWHQTFETNFTCSGYEGIFMPNLVSLRSQTHMYDIYIVVPATPPSAYYICIYLCKVSIPVFDYFQWSKGIKTGSNKRLKYLYKHIIFIFCYILMK